MGEQVKILIQGDSPACSTGFGRVNRYILEALAPLGLDVTIIGVNQRSGLPINEDGSFGDYDHVKFPYTILDPFDFKDDEPQGYTLFEKTLAEGDWDIVFTHNDFNIIGRLSKSILKYKEEHPKTVWIAYCPVDLDDMWEVQLNGFDKADVCLTYTKFGYDIILKHRPELKNRLSYVYLPTDMREFSVLSDAQRKYIRKAMFGITSDDTFLIVNVNKNQWRKRLYKTAVIFSEFQKKHPDSLLYFHCHTASTTGGNIAIQSHRAGVIEKTIVLPAPDKNGHLATQEGINNIYNAADVVISTACGEGWGYSSVEGLVTKTPILFPRHTSLTEIVGENEERGYLMDAGKDLNFIDVAEGFSDLPRSQVDVYSGIEKLEHIYNNRREAKLKAHHGYKWVRDNCSLPIVGQKWLDLFTEMMKIVK